jgi:hypothetical protein
MNTSLSTFMKIAITAVVISAFIFGAMYLTMGDLANTIADYVTKNGQ